MEFARTSPFIHLFVYDIGRNGVVQPDRISCAIDGETVPSPAEPSESNPHLFRIRWSPENYIKGIHYLTVSYSNGLYTANYSHPFFLTPESLSSFLMQNSSLSSLDILDATSPGRNVGGFLVNSYLVPVLFTLAYTLPLLFVLFLIIGRLTFLHIFPYRLDDSAESRYHVYHHLFRRKTFQNTPLLFKAFLLICSDRWVVYFLTISLLWQTFGFWSFGKFPSEFGIQSLWGVLFLFGTENGNYSLWLDLYLWHVMTLFCFYIPLMVYFAVFMIPHPALPEATSASRWSRLCAHVLCVIYFVGIFFFVKLYVCWINFHNISFLFSPMFLWIPLANSVLLGRELYFEWYFMRNNPKKPLYDSTDTVLITNAYCSVCFQCHFFYDGEVFVQYSRGRAVLVQLELLRHLHVRFYPRFVYLEQSIYERNGCGLQITNRLVQFTVSFPLIHYAAFCMFGS